MTRPRCTTVLQRLLDGASLPDLAYWLRSEHGMRWPVEPLDYVEQCIRRGLRGEVRVTTTKQRKK